MQTEKLEKQQHCCEKTNEDRRNCNQAINFDSFKHNEEREHIKLGFFAANLYTREVMRLVNFIFFPMILQKIAFLFLPTSLNIGTDTVLISLKTQVLQDSTE